MCVLKSNDAPTFYNCGKSGKWEITTTVQNAQDEVHVIDEKKKEGLVVDRTTRGYFDFGTDDFLKLKTSPGLAYEEAGDLEKIWLSRQKLGSIQWLGAGAY